MKFEFTEAQVQNLKQIVFSSSLHANNLNEAKAFVKIMDELLLILNNPIQEETKQPDKDPPKEDK